MPSGVTWNRAQLEALPGLTLHDLMLMPIERMRSYFDRLFAPSPSTGEGWGGGENVEHKPAASQALTSPQPSPGTTKEPFQGSGRGGNASDGTNQALQLLLTEIRTRLKYLCDVGIGYLTLDRQSRTLSGGEVSASTSRPHSAPRSSTRCSCWTNPASACIRAT